MKLSMVRRQHYLPQNQKNSLKNCTAVKSSWSKRLLTVSIIMILILTIFFLSACGGMGRINSLRSVDFISDDVIEIPLSFKYGYRPGNTTEVLCQYSISEMAEKIRALSSEEVEYIVSEYPWGKLLIEIKGTEDKKAVALLTEISSRDTTEVYPHFYVFFSPVAVCSGTQLVFPFHLVKDERLETYFDSIEPDLKYRTDYGLDEFLNFYSRLGDYYPQLDPEKIQVLDNGFIIKNNYVKNESRNVEIEFHFQDGGKYFTVQFNE